MLPLAVSHCSQPARSASQAALQAARQLCKHPARQAGNKPASQAEALQVLPTLLCTATPDICSCSSSAQLLSLASSSSTAAIGLEVSWLQRRVYYFFEWVKYALSLKQIWSWIQIHSRLMNWTMISYVNSFIGIQPWITIFRVPHSTELVYEFIIWIHIWFHINSAAWNWPWIQKPEFRNDFSSLNSEMISYIW